MRLTYICLFNVHYCIYSKKCPRELFVSFQVLYFIAICLMAHVRSLFFGWKPGYVNFFLGVAVTSFFQYLVLYFLMFFGIIQQRLPIGRWQLMVCDLRMHCLLKNLIKSLIKGRNQGPEKSSKFIVSHFSML